MIMMILYKSYTEKLLSNLYQLSYFPRTLNVENIHETEIKQFRNRNGQNRVEIILTLGHKSWIVETDYEVETNYKGRNEL